MKITWFRNKAYLKIYAVKPVKTESVYSGILSYGKKVRVPGKKIYFILKRQYKRYQDGNIFFL